MHRRACLATLVHLPLLASSCARRRAPATPRTRWTVAASEGLDLLCLLGPLSGDPFYAEWYPQELAQLVPRLDADTITTIQSLKSAAAARHSLLGPNLCLLFSAGPTDTLAQLRDSLERAEHVLLPTYRASPYWEADDWAWFIAARPALARLFAALADAELPAFRRALVGDRATRRETELRARLAGVDVIAEQERLLGRPLRPDIQIDLLHFSKPHGIKVQGQRFLTHLDYSDETVIRNAAHEILHPPFDESSPAIRDVLAVLAGDPLLTRIVAEHDPRFGYTSLAGYLDEDTTEALEQLVNERLGVAVPAGERWRRADDGMHVLAAGLYGLLRADGFDRTGGAIEAWLGAAARDGRLAPSSLHAAAAAVLERPRANLWTPATASL